MNCAHKFYPFLMEEYDLPFRSYVGGGVLR